MQKHHRQDYKNTCAIIQEGPDGKYYLQLFTQPEAILSTHRLEEVSQLIAEASAAAQQNKYAVGFVSYEAAPAFDRACSACRNDRIPLAWFAVYRKSELMEIPPYRHNVYVSPAQPALSLPSYIKNIERIKDHIAAGDTYQVNFTFPLHGQVAGDLLDLFVGLFRQQPTPYATFIGTDEHIICSASPELFFHQSGDQITCCPMKGTQPADEKSPLDRSQKNRAENIMIVDMIRNDLGRICRPGSIRCRDLFQVHHYETVKQMTSTIEGVTQANAGAVFEALFPCASVTGAPKIQTCSIINNLEQHPRGVYTGAAGHFAPHDSARFNVAIRTVTVERESGRYSYGIGSGITWDSSPEQEYRECLDKSRILPCADPSFHLFTTMLKTPAGVTLLTAHLQRLKDSAAFFKIPFSVKKARRQLAGAPDQLNGESQYRIRLLLFQDGQLKREDHPLTAMKKRWHLALGKTPVCTDSIYLDHKTSNRDIYNQQLAAHPGADDVLLWNQHNELTESCYANIILHLDGRWVTPEPASSFLRGTRRAAYISTGRVHPITVSKKDLSRAKRIYLTNAVRALIPVKLTT